MPAVYRRAMRSATARSSGPANGCETTQAVGISATLQRLVKSLDSPYLCPSSASSSRRGGAWAELLVSAVHARTPSLISVLAAKSLRSGDVMVDGVLRDAMRPLCL
jgi:hypothetical protein